MTQMVKPFFQNNYIIRSCQKQNIVVFSDTLEGTLYQLILGKDYHPVRVQTHKLAQLPVSVNAVVF